MQVFICGPDLLHPCRRHDVQTTIAVIFLPSLGRASHPSFYSQQAGVPSLRRYSVERSSAPRHISAVTRDLQTAPQVVLVLSVLFGHSHLTHRAFIFVDLAIIDIILATLKIMMMMMMMTSLEMAKQRPCLTSHIPVVLA